MKTEPVTVFVSSEEERKAWVEVMATTSTPVEYEIVCKPQDPKRSEASGFIAMHQRQVRDPFLEKLAEWWDNNWIGLVFVAFFAVVIVVAVSIGNRWDATHKTIIVCPSGWTQTLSGGEIWCVSPDGAEFRRAWEETIEINE